MKYKNKGISPVVATALLLVVAVVSVVVFQGWFSTFSSSMFTKTEQESGSSLNTQIENVIGDTLYFKNGNSNNLTITQVKINGIDCGVGANLTSGMNSINITNCSNNLSEISEAVVYTSKGIYSKKFYVNSIAGSSIPIPVVNLLNVNYLWNESYGDMFTGDMYEDTGVGIVMSSLNEIYVTGYTYDGSTYNYILVKYDSDGNEIWNKSYDTGFDEKASGIVLDTSNNILISGSSSLNGVNNDFYTIKYDSDGVEIWNKSYNSGFDDMASAIAVDSLNNVYVTGYYSDGSTNNYDLVKYDTNGNKIWNITYDGGFEDYSTSIAVDSSNNILVSGITSDGTNYFYSVIKYDTNGNIVWNKYYTSSFSDNEAYGLTLDNSNNIYVTGYICDSFCDYYTLKLDSNGNEIWNASYDSGDDDDATSIFVDTSGNSYVTGNYWDGVNNNIYTIKYDSNGNEVWNVSFDGGFGGDYANDILVDTSNNIYLVGNSFSGGSVNLLFIKYSQN